MIRPLEITGLGKSFVTPTGPFTAVRDFNLVVQPGEFICLLGHSGCGKSTVLSILAGLQRATQGGFCIDGKEVDYPGTNRGVVFQSPRCCRGCPLRIMSCSGSGRHILT